MMFSTPRVEYQLEVNMKTEFKSETSTYREKAIGAARAKRHQGLTLIGLVLGIQLLLGGVGTAARADTLECFTICRNVRLTVALEEGQPATYEVSGQLCYQSRSQTVQVLVSGATYSHTYWDFPLHPQQYSYVRAMARAGFATFNLDRIGIGESDHPPADQVTIQANAFVIHQIVQALRDGRLGSFPQVVLVGHSLGSGIALNEAAHYGDVNGLILTGFLHAFGPGFAQLPAILYPAQNDPRFAGRDIPAGYLTSLPGQRPAFYFTPAADPNVIALDELTKETITIGEVNTFPPLVPSPDDAKNIHVPVLYVIGQQDNIFCTPPQCPEAQAESGFFPPDTPVDVKVLPYTGHSLNLHRSAPAVFATVLDWTVRHFPN